MSGNIGKFHIKRTLGQGGSCKVKYAVNTETKEKVAIKILNEDLTDEIRDHVMQEVKIMESLTHLNIIRQLEHGQEVYESKSGSKKKVNYIVLELA